MDTVLWNFCSNYVYLWHKWGYELDLQGQEKKKGVTFDYIHLLAVLASFMSTQHKLKSSEKRGPQLRKRLQHTQNWQWQFSCDQATLPVKGLEHQGSHITFELQSVCPPMGYARVRVA